MTSSPLVRAISERLVKANFKPVQTPFRVASVSFDFTLAMRGSAGRSSDLIIIVDTTTGEFGDKEPTQVRRRVEALSRALDVTKSRLVLTVILAGAAMTGDIDELSEICRVLTVETIPVEPDGTPRDEIAKRMLDDRIRLLLPLEIPLRDAEGEVEFSPMDRLVNALPTDTDAGLRLAVVEGSRLGDEAVTASTATVIDAALEDTP
ncbi:hypothetical protein [Devosia sp. MC1541]|uniref:hypothetical protein n=1 Tax=Devosia sp. MC1541 TaxID=2725264 RepID=UPI00145D4288|nr:hypothetical protein [Devosia sp. MC1541]